MIAPALPIDIEPPDGWTVPDEAIEAVAELLLEAADDEDGQRRDT